MLATGLNRKKKNATQACILANRLVRVGLWMS